MLKWIIYIPFVCIIALIPIPDFWSGYIIGVSVMVFTLIWIKESQTNIYKCPVCQNKKSVENE